MFRSPYRQTRGFTLMELLIVMVVIGLSAGMAVFSLSGGTRPYEARNAVKRLYAQMSLAVEEAILNSREYGLLFEPNLDNTEGKEQYVYHWLVLDTAKNRWEPVLDDDVFGEVKLPEDMRLELEIEGQPAAMGGQKKDEKQSLLATMGDTELARKMAEEDELDEDGNKRRKLVPDLYFLSSGELVAFKLELVDAAQDSQPRFTLKGEMVGKIRLYQPGDVIPDEEGKGVFGKH